MSANDSEVEATSLTENEIRARKAGEYAQTVGLSEGPLTPAAASKEDIDWGNIKEIEGQQIVGAGDVVAKVLASKAVSPITKFLKGVIFKNGEDCGCDDRRRSLNKKIFKRYPVKPIRCLRRREYEFLEAVLPRIEREVAEGDLARIINIHASVFGYGPVKAPCLTCMERNKRYINDLRQIFESYDGAPAIDYADLTEEQKNEVDGRGNNA